MPGLETSPELYKYAGFSGILMFHMALYSSLFKLSVIFSFNFDNFKMFYVIVAFYIPNKHYLSNVWIFVLKL